MRDARCSTDLQPARSRTGGVRSGCRGFAGRLGAFLLRSDVEVPDGLRCSTTPPVPWAARPADRRPETGTALNCACVRSFAFRETHLVRVVCVVVALAQSRPGRARTANELGRALQFRRARRRRVGLGRQRDRVCPSPRARQRRRVAGEGADLGGVEDSVEGGVEEGGQHSAHFVELLVQGHHLQRDAILITSSVWEPVFLGLELKYAQNTMLLFSFGCSCMYWYC